MFSGSPRKRNGVSVIPMGAVSQIALCGDDPDFIVLEVFDASFSGSTVALPSTAPIGKVFRFALVTDCFANPQVSSTQYVDIVIPLRSNVLNSGKNYWRLCIGQRPTFVYGPNGWIVDGGGLSVNLGAAGTNAGVLNIGAIAMGSGSSASGLNGQSGGVAIGVNAIGNQSGVAIGGGATGVNSIAIGGGSNGSSQGVAIGGGAMCGYSGIAIGRNASGNGKAGAIALGFYATAQRESEFVVATGGGGTQSYSFLNWYGDTATATQTELFLGSGRSLATVMAKSAFIFKLLAVARDNVNNVVSAWEITGAIKRDASNNTALVGSVTTTVIAQDTAASAWNIAVLADDINEALSIKVTGAAATTIRWNVRGDISELRF